MAKEIMLSGCAAAAQGAKFAEVEVICSYPIRPYTAIMMELSRMVANGELDAEFIHGEGEHAQVSVVLGASAAVHAPTQEAPAWASPMPLRFTARRQADGTRCRWRLPTGPSTPPEISVRNTPMPCRQGTRAG